jgi:type II secretory pathway component GspD/PulD (secretin)
VRLAVLARAGADGNISLDLRPTLSFLRQFTQVPGGGQLPQTSERTTQSTAVIKSGETIALGGLIQDFDRKTVGGIPILKDLPIVGALFRRTDNSKVRTEVVFFLTARIVDDTTRQDAARPTGGAIPPKSEVKN